MSDLSNLLGDLYSTPDPDGPGVRHEAPAADRLGAPATEAMPSWTTAAPAADPFPAMPEVPAEWGSPAAMAAPQAELRLWTRGDDDIFPAAR